VGVDVGPDGGFELGDRAEDAAAERSIGQESKEAFDLIDPLGRCGREVHMPARPLGKPVRISLVLWVP
jgi:hypothetical protein